MRQRFEITHYRVKTEKDIGSTRVVFLADIHDRYMDEVIGMTAGSNPDIIVIGGDLVNWFQRANSISPHANLKNLVFGYDYTHTSGHLYDSNCAVQFLNECSGIAPTVYTIGNHERYFDDRDIKIIKDSGCILLDNESCNINGISIGGLSSFRYGMICEEKLISGNQDRSLDKRRGRSFSPNAELEWLDPYCQSKSFKLLICHHPEYYPKYLKERNIDLILSGHAHGGQIRIGEKGLFTPDQGLFPKYTNGFVNNKMIISRGIGNLYKYIPRINNPGEIVVVDILK